MKITHYEEWCFYITRYFSTVSVHFYSSVPTRNKCVHALSCSRSQVQPARITSSPPPPPPSSSSSSPSSYQTLHRRLNCSRLQSIGNLRVLYQGCRVDGVTMFTHHLWGLPESLNLCEDLHYHAEAQFLLDSCEAELVWNSPEFCQCPGVDVRIVSSCIITSTRIIPSPSQKTVTITVPAHRLYEPFLPRRLRMVPFHGLPFSLQFKMMAPAYIWCNNWE